MKVVADKVVMVSVSGLVFQLSVNAHGAQGRQGRRHGISVCRLMIGSTS